MHRRHVTVISLFLAVALVLGVAAMLRTANLGAASTASGPSAAQIAARNHRLDLAEARLRAAAAKKPPALPVLPAAASGRRTTAAAPAPQQKVVYVRPAPIVETVHRSGEHEDAYEGEHDD